MTAEPPKPAAFGQSVLLYGPTASGKSALALAAAEAVDGVIFNADALQIYDGFEILTARPSSADCARAEHQFYGHVPPETPDHSVGRWLRALAPALAAAQAAERPTLVVGGSGLYFKALTQGLADIPEPDPVIRKRLEAEAAAEGLAPALARLDRDDPETAQRVDRANPRRVLRALEVLEQTGRGLAAWGRATPPPILPLSATAAFRVTLERNALRARIARRLRTMIAAGALDEVAAMRARGLDWSRPAMKALGARAFAAHLDGETTLDAARDAAVIETGRYAKRQDTWGRNQMGAWATLDAAAPETALAALVAALGGPKRASSSVA